jgi:hypothetical protein
MVNSAWAGDVRWVCSRAGWTGTPPRPPPPGSQAACTPCLVQTLMASSNTRHSTPLHGVHSTTEGHLGVYCCSEGATVGVCAGKSQFRLANRFVGGSLSCTPPSLPPSWCTKHVATRERCAHFCRWQHRPGCVALTFQAHPRGGQTSLLFALGRVRLGACTRYHRVHSCQQPWCGSVGMRGGCAQHQVCTSTVTTVAWPSDEDSPTTLQLLLFRPSAHAPQCNGIQRLALRGHLA